MKAVDDTALPSSSLIDGLAKANASLCKRYPVGLIAISSGQQIDGEGDEYQCATSEDAEQPHHPAAVQEPNNAGEQENARTRPN
jgi:hypothetical protein